MIVGDDQRRGSERGGFKRRRPSNPLTVWPSGMESCSTMRCNGGTAVDDKNGGPHRKHLLTLPSEGMTPNKGLTTVKETPNPTGDDEVIGSVGRNSAGGGFVHPDTIRPPCRVAGLDPKMRSEFAG